MIDCSKTENYLAEKKRMTKITNTGVCKIKCTNCPLSEKNNGKGRLCVDYELHYPEKAIEIVQKWSDEHPRRTYLTELLKIFPNTPLKDDETPEFICPYYLGLKDIDNCDDNSDIKEINRIKFKIVKINNTAHAQWTVSKFANDYYSCTGCGSVWSRTFDFCPSCGAKMDKE